MRTGLDGMYIYIYINNKIYGSYNRNRSFYVGFTQGQHQKVHDEDHERIPLHGGRRIQGSHLLVGALASGLLSSSGIWTSRPSSTLNPKPLKLRNFGIEAELKNGKLRM